MPEFEAKNASFAHFWARTLKGYCHIWNQHLWISVIAKLSEETKMPKFDTKNALFRNCRQKVHYLGIFGQKVGLEF